MAGRGTRGRPARQMDVPEPSTPEDTSGQGGRARQYDPPVGQQADLPPPSELGGFLQAFPSLVQAFQLQAQTQAALQSQMQEAMAAPAAAAHQERLADLECAHGASMMERFRRMGPPSFKGESSPD